MKKKLKIDQLLKWVATFILGLGGIINSLGHYPLGPIVLGCGSLVWLIVSIMWKEKSLIVTNSLFLVLTFGTLIFAIKS